LLEIPKTAPQCREMLWKHNCFGTLHSALNQLKENLPKESRLLEKFYFEIKTKWNRNKNIPQRVSNY
jgi:hypothetical protein